MFGVSSCKKSSLPDYFKPILWSYDFSAVNPEKHQQTIIINAINYGNLEHWRWLISNYGKKAVADVLRKVSVTELRPAARRLASIIFSIDNFNYVPRGVRR